MNEDQMEMLFFAVLSMICSAVMSWLTERLNAKQPAAPVEPRDPYMEAALAEVEELLA